MQNNQYNVVMFVQHPILKTYNIDIILRPSKAHSAVDKNQKAVSILEEVNAMRIEFKAVLILLLDLLEHGDVDRAIERIREILNVEKNE